MSAQREAQHTPGPWALYQRKPHDRAPHESEFHIGAPQFRHTVGEVAREEDARLIAQAPALLAALEAYVADDYERHGSTSKSAALNARLSAARTAIAAARGAK